MRTKLHLETVRRRLLAAPMFESSVCGHVPVQLNKSILRKVVNLRR